MSWRIGERRADSAACYPRRIAQRVVPDGAEGRNPRGGLLSSRRLYRRWSFRVADAFGSIGLCASALWIRAKTVDQEERGNAERRALFAGLWAPTLWGIGTSLEQRE